MGDDLRTRGVLPVLALAALLVLIGLIWFRAPPIHALDAAAAESAPPRQESTLLVSADWVAERLDDPGTVLLHVASEAPTRLIPGALWLPYDAIADRMGGRFMVELRPADELARALGERGVSNEAHVILYAEGPPHTSARAFVTLDWLGHGARTSVLDGGLEAWVASGRQTTTEAASATPATFVPSVRSDVLVDAEWIRDRLGDPSTTLIDARPIDEYTGRREQRGLRGGHIPGAYNLYFMDLVESDRTPWLIDVEAVRARFEEAGADEGPVVSYCYIGMRASYTYLVSKHLGYDARFYDPSWHEWGAREELPIVSGRSRR
jgi:thiosulfate/3-mercaptopyruvate sulfurtransferase